MKLQYFLFPIIVAGGTVPKYRKPNTTTSSSPCQEIAQSSAAAMAANAIAQPTVSAQLAYDCLTSVSLHADDGTALVNAILPYVEWQSDVSYLKNPPKGYLMGATDVWGNFDAILKNIASGAYADEHAFQADLFASFNIAHDGHFRFMPDLLSKALSFSRPIALVSVSADGVKIPKIYLKADIITYNFNSGGGGDVALPPAVDSINGQETVKFLQNWGNLGILQDPDALYNNVFYEMAFDAQNGGGYNGYFAGDGRFGLIYPGPNTTLTFSNVTSVTFDNYANLIGDWSTVMDGESMYQKFCTGPHLVPTPSNVSYPFPTPPPLPPTAIVPPVGYPVPQVISGDSQVGGYFLPEDDYSDVAVLSMLSFAPEFPVEFQSVVETFISMSRAAGKTKLVIDLSGNGGGTIHVGYDTFRQLFPSIVQDGYTRFREHEAFNILSEQISLYSSNFDAATADNEKIFAYISATDYRSDLNETDGKFLNYEDKFGPHVYNADNFASLMRWDLDDPLTTIDPLWGVGETITGYGDRKNFTQPFDAVDIVLVYDGYCASTCTLFSEFMRVQAAVKSIAFGGRPSTDAIQAIGGVKGANNYGYGYIQTLASIPLSNASDEQRANWTSLTAYTDLPMNRSSDNSLNVRDHILRPNLEDGIPAQFVYEEADCRVFYEPSMINDVTAIWKRAADVAWGGGKCVAGSLPGNETMAARRRKTEKTKLKAKRDRRIPLHKRGFRSLVTSKGMVGSLHGQKVPL